MRKTIFTGLIVCLISLIAIVPVAIGAPGDLVWTQASNPSVSWDDAYAVAVDGTGAYIVGVDNYAGNPRWRIEKRSLTTGSSIWNQASNPSTSWDEAYGVAVDGSGVYIVGHDASLGNNRWRIEKRSLTTGSIIWTQTSNPSPYGDVAYGVAVDGTGLYIVGYDQYPGPDNRRWRIEKRSLTTGSVIWTQASNPSSAMDEALGVAVDATGVYIVGYDNYLGIPRWRMEKRSLTTGTSIWTQTSNPSPGWDFANAVTVDGTGVYIVGRDEYLGSDNPRWRIEKRSLTTGTSIWNTASNPSTTWDEPLGVATDGSGLYIVGFDEYPGTNSRWRIEKRNLTTGNNLWTKTSNPSSYSDEAYGVATYGGGVYIVGYDSYSGGRRWRIEKREP